MFFLKSYKYAKYGIFIVCKYETKNQLLDFVKNNSSKYMQELMTADYIYKIHLYYIH